MARKKLLGAVIGSSAAMCAADPQTFAFSGTLSGLVIYRAASARLVRLNNITAQYGELCLSTRLCEKGTNLKYLCGRQSKVSRSEAYAAEARGLVLSSPHHLNFVQAARSCTWFLLV